MTLLVKAENQVQVEQKLNAKWYTLNRAHHTGYDRYTSAAILASPFDEVIQVFPHNCGAMVLVIGWLLCWLPYMESASYKRKLQSLQLQSPRTGSGVKFQHSSFWFEIMKTTAAIYICCIVAVILTTTSAGPLPGEESRDEAKFGAKFGPISRQADTRLAEFARVMLRGFGGCCYAGSPCPECLIIKQFCCSGWTVKLF